MLPIGVSTTHSPLQSRRQEGSSVNISDIKTVVVSKACLGSRPCQHLCTVTLLNEKTKETFFKNHQIYLLCSVLSPQQIFFHERGHFRPFCDERGHFRPLETDKRLIQSSIDQKLTQLFNAKAP